MSAIIEEEKSVNKSATYDLGTRQIELIKPVVTDQILNIPILSDTVALEFDMKLLSKTNKPLPKLSNYTKLIDHIRLASTTGMIKAIIPGNFLELLHIRFSSSHTKMIISPDGSSEVPMYIPGITLPRSYGPWQLTVFYNDNGWSKKRKDIILSNHIGGYYGNVNGMIGRYISQEIPLYCGSNMIQTLAVPQNVPINELMLRGLTGSNPIRQILLQSNGQIIEPNTSGGILRARANALLVDKLPKDSLIFLSTTDFVLNSSSEFDIVTNNTQPSVEVLWHWYEDDPYKGPSKQSLKKINLKKIKYVNPEEASLKDLNLPPPPEGIKKRSKKK